MELNVSNRLEKNSDNIKEELGDVIKELSSIEGSVVDMIKEMEPTQVAQVLENNYQRKNPEDISRDHGRAAMVQTAISLIQNEQFKDDKEYEPLTIDGIYGPKTKGAVMMFQLENGLNGEGWAGPKTIAKLIEKLRNGTDSIPKESNESLITETQETPTNTPVGIPPRYAYMYSNNNKNTLESNASIPVKEKLIDGKKLAENGLLLENLVNNKLEEYRKNEIIPEGTFTGGSAYLNGKSVGETLYSIFSASGAAKPTIAPNMETLFNWDEGKDANLYAIALYKAMKGFATNETLVDKTITIGNSYNLLEPIFNAFGKIGGKNLIQRVASELQDSPEMYDEFHIYLQQFVAAGDITKKAVKDFVLSGEDNNLYYGLRNDESFKKSIDVAYDTRWRETVA